MEILILIATIILLAVAERTPLLRFQRSRFLRPFFATDAFYFLSGGVALALAMRAQASKLARSGALPSLQSLDLPFPLLAVLATVLYDLGAYAAHVLLHRIDLLWRIHKVHHSSRTLDWLATFRGHILEHALRHLVSPVLLILAGFPVAAVALAGAVYGSWAAFVHANVRVDLRRLQPVLITPRLHRLHHVADASEYNLGTIFSFWDRMRGTLLADAAAPEDPIGVPGEVETYPQTWLPQLLEPLRPDRGETRVRRSASNLFHAPRAGSRWM